MNEQCVLFLCRSDSLLYLRSLDDVKEWKDAETAVTQMVDNNSVLQLQMKEVRPRQKQAVL